MAKSQDNTRAARQVELIIRQLSSLSTLPEVAAAFMTTLADSGSDAARVIEIIESDPALTARVFELAHEQGVVFKDNIPSIDQAISKLDPEAIRDAILSVKVFQAFDDDCGADLKHVLPRKQLALHGLAVACCSKMIAEAIGGAGQLAFSAGLLHDIGKLAIAQVMPKSFDSIVSQAKERGVSMDVVEKEQLGLDHAIIGKRLAEKWHLPEEIAFAIWLHHSDAASLTGQISAGNIAGIVHVADSIARACRIGQSGSYGPVENIAADAFAIGLSEEQLKGIRSGLAAEVDKRSAAMGFGQKGAGSAFCDLAHEAAAKFAKDNTSLKRQKVALTAAAANTDIISQFLQGVGPSMTVAEVSAKFAGLWQKHYQTGAVCVYTAGGDNDGIVEAAIVDQSGKCETVLLTVPEDCSILPGGLLNEFGVVEAGDQCEWLLNQLDWDSYPTRTKILPLLIQGRAVGGLVFDQRMPSDAAECVELFSAPAATAASVIALALATEKQSRLAEDFASLLSSLKTTRDELSETKMFSGVSEMAAGAAHELNNPLAVISGRAQLLCDGESDPDKKQMLQQIYERTEEMSSIVRDLMSFAKPTVPVYKGVGVGVLVDAALSQASELLGINEIELCREGLDGLGEVHVDSQQVSAAIAAVIVNALQSYKGGSGPVTITGKCHQVAGYSTIKITDTGCGMDRATVDKAFQPFFSAKEAGRSRGMGLSQAKRLLQVNNGSIYISSMKDEGTAVTVKLPRA